MTKTYLETEETDAVAFPGREVGLHLGHALRVDPVVGHLVALRLKDHVLGLKSKKLFQIIILP
jgi:hypothetical protein